MADFVPPSSGIDYTPPAYDPTQASDKKEKRTSEPKPKKIVRTERSLMPEIPSTVQQRVPKGCSKLCRIEYYQQFFECETKEVMYRVLQALIIFKGNFLQETAEKKRDLWLPIWNAITLIFLLFFSTGLILLIRGEAETATSYVSLGIYTAIVLGYLGIVPIVFYGICHCLNYEELKYYVISCLYSYSFIIFIPVSIIIPFTVWMAVWIMYIIFAVAGGWSTVFFAVTLLKYLVKTEVDKKSLIGLSTAFVLLHVGVIIGLGCALFLGTYRVGPTPNPNG